MNLQFYQEKLETSEVFQKFRQENPEAYLSSAFFTISIIDKAQTIETQLDYFNPKQSNFQVFQLNDFSLKQEQASSSAKPEPLTSSTLDINKLALICENLLKQNNINEKLVKIIAILTSQNNLPVFSLNLITSSMSVIKAKLNDAGGCLRFEKLNLFDFIKKPGGF